MKNPPAPLYKERREDVVSTFRCDVFMFLKKSTGLKSFTTLEKYKK